MFEPIDIIVIVIAISLCIILMLAFYGFVVRGCEINHTRKELILVLLAGAISVLSIYIGSKLEEDPCCALLKEKGGVRIEEKTGG